MKKAFWLIAVLLSVGMAGYCQDQDVNNGDDAYYPQPSSIDDQDLGQQYDDTTNGATYQEFYDQLSPYGQWVNEPGYGNVWVPNDQDDNFSPYASNGDWVYSDLGWTWVSGYPWGWACFHYGNWFLDDTYGWMWLPGYNWAPAWVVWGNYGGYYCWAPIGPRGYIGAGYRPEGRYWNFVKRDHMMDRDLYGQVKENRGLVRSSPDIVNHIDVISNANTYHKNVYFAGPRADDVAKVTGHQITAVHIASDNRPGATHVAGNQLNIYRPAIRQTAHQPAPAKVARPEDLKPVNRPGEQAQPGHAAPAEVQPTHAAPAQPQPSHAAPASRTQSFTPPRQSTPTPSEAPHGRYFEPNPAPARSAPSAPSRSFSPPAGGGGGGFHGGGGGGRR